MTNEARQLYTKKIKKRYKEATKSEKSKILDEYCKICDYTRKYAIRKLALATKIAKPKPRGAKPIYDFSFTCHLVRLWKAMGRMCSKRMKAALPLWLPYDTTLGLTEEIRAKLLQVSPSTIDRLLRPWRQAWKKGKSATRPGSLIKAQIPIELLKGKIKEPGYIEADTVAHCGNSLLGQFAYTLTMTDLFSGWTENRATWGKSSHEVLNKIKEVRSALPFRLKGFACDNGSEFINHEVLRYFAQKHTAARGQVKFTRRRPYHKNDACHVEQKNDTHVRQLFGYSRLDNPEFIELMNDIYANYWNILQNFFYPNMKLIKKVRVGARVRKKYDSPKTAYERLMQSSHLTDIQKQNLKLTMEGLNPLDLQKTLEKKVSLFHSLLTIEQMTGGPTEQESAIA